jgi:pimeloyl-ACP methyl ester carboxylesterase
VHYRTLLGSPVEIEGPGGNRIACQVAGPPDAPPVVLTSGIGCGPVFYRHIAPVLAERYRTVYWDYRAHGESGLAPDGRSYRIEDHSRDLDTVIRALTDRPPFLVGFSMGVQVTLEWVRRHERAGVLAYVFLLGMPHNPLYTHWFWGSTIMRRSLAGALDIGGARIVPRLHFLSKAVLRNRFSYTVARRTGLVTDDFTWRDYDEFIHYSSGVRPDAYLRTAVGVLDHAADDVWERLDAPVLYAWSGRDRIVPTSECQSSARGLKDARTHELDGRSHAGMVESGRELALEIRDFLDAHAPGRTSDTLSNRTTTERPRLETRP